MRYGIFSDVHSNAEAFEAVIGALGKEDIDVYICGGDIVGYGADPSRCIEMVKGLTGKCVCGNHEWGSVGLLDVSFFNPFAWEAVLWTRKKLDILEKEYLKNLGVVYEDKNITVAHGSLNKPEQFHYILNTCETSATLNLMETQICFIGHSHRPAVFMKTEQGVMFSAAAEVNIREGVLYIINVGSVGQPRDGDPRACYAVFDTDKKYVGIKRISYDIKKAQKKILGAGLPPILADRLSEGR